MPTASPGFDSLPASPPRRLLLAHKSSPLLGKVTAEAASQDTGNLAASLSFVSVISLNRQQLSLPLYTLSGQSCSYFHFPDWERVKRRHYLPFRWGKPEAGFEPRFSPNPLRSFPMWLPWRPWIPTPSFSRLPSKADIPLSPVARRRPWERLQRSHEAWRGWLGLNPILSLEVRKLSWPESRIPCLTKTTSSHLSSVHQLVQSVSLA